MTTAEDVREGFFNEDFEALTEDGTTLAIEVEDALRPIFRGWRSKGYPYRAVGHVAVVALGGLESELVLRAALDERGASVEGKLVVARRVPQVLRDRVADALAHAGFAPHWVDPIRDGTADERHVRSLWQSVSGHARNDAQILAEGWVVAFGIAAGMELTSDGTFHDLRRPESPA